MNWQRIQNQFADAAVKEKESYSVVTDFGNTHLTAVLGFLHTEVIEKETIDAANKLAETTIASQTGPSIPTAASLVSLNQSRESTSSFQQDCCVFCDKIGHTSQDCAKAARMDYRHSALGNTRQRPSCSRPDGSESSHCFQSTSDSNYSRDFLSVF